MSTVSNERLADAEWLEEAARYFEKRDTGGEDMAFWANVMNAERCRSIAQSLRAQGGVKPLEWKGPDEHTAYGEQGGFIYTVMSPNRTPGWRVWIYLKSFEGLSSSVGGVILTVKAETMKDAMSAAQADYERRILSSLEASPAPVSEQVRALQAFKDYVHKRLDDAGIPPHPDGEHSKAGCRIGDRLDIALAAKGGQ